MLPTGLGFKGIVFFAALVAAFLAAPYLNLFFLLLAFLAVLAITSAYWTRANLRGVEADVTAIDPAPAGRPARTHLHVTTPDARARRGLSVTLLLNLPNQPRGRRRRPRRGPTRVEVGHLDRVVGSATGGGEAPPLPRGLHAVREARVESVFPFGLFRAFRAAAAPSHVVVYPAPADLGDARTRRQLLAELHGEQASEEPGDLGPSGLRDYRPGDEPRQVHWKASARRAELVVREWEGDAERGLEVVLDLRGAAAASKSAPKDALEEALAELSALALWARANGEVLRLHSQDQSETYGEGHRPWRELLTYLAGAQPLPAEAAAPPPAPHGAVRLPTGRRRAPRTAEALP